MYKRIDIHNPEGDTYTFNEKEVIENVKELLGYLYQGTGEEQPIATNIEEAIDLGREELNWNYEEQDND